MKKILLFLSIVGVFLFAESINIKDFKTDIVSRNGKSRKIAIGLVIEGRYVKDEKYKIKDALNIVLSGFYIEDLLTAKGKEAFKKSFTEYLAKRYSVDIDNVFIQKFITVKKCSDEDFIKALKRAGCCKD